MMNNSKLNCSLNDVTKLRERILENPDLPLLIFAGADAWSDTYPYEMTKVNSVSVEELILCEDYWLNKEEYEDKLFCDLVNEKEYKDLTYNEFEKVIARMVEKAEFVKAIVVYVG